MTTTQAPVRQASRTATVAAAGFLALGALAAVAAVLMAEPVSAAEPVTPTIHIAADRTYVYPGDVVTITATLDPNPSGGDVTFAIVDWDAMPVGTVPVGEDGTASFPMTATIGYATTGWFRVQVTFSGSDGFYWAQAGFTMEMRYFPGVVYTDPPGPSNSTSAEIPFVVGDGVTTECRLDGTDWAPCTSPWSGSGLTEGMHTLDVRGTSADGRTGRPYPATWAVDLTPPQPAELSLDGGAPTTNHVFLDLVATATDELSGVAMVRWSASPALDDEGNLAEVSHRYEPDRPAQFGVDMTGTSGPQSIYAQWFDAAGNASAIATATIDVRVAWVHLADGVWATTSSQVPLVIDGVDPGEIEAIRIGNLAPSWSEAAADPVELAAVPATWDVAEAGHSYLAGPGFRAVEVTWLDAGGHWSSPRYAAVALVDAPRSDVVLDEGATVTLDPIAQADLSITPVQYRGYGFEVMWSCNATDWAHAHAWPGLVPLRVAGDWPGLASGCPESPGDRTIEVRWRWYETAWSPSRAATIDYQPDPSLPGDDQTPPVGDLSIAGGRAAVTDDVVSVAVPATDAASGVTNVRLSNDGRTWVTRPYAAHQAWTLSPGDGARRVWVAWRDGAANWSPPVSGDVLLDTVRPTVAAPAVRPVAGVRARRSGALPVLVSWTGADAGSGVAGYDIQASVDGGSWRTIGERRTEASLRRVLRPGASYQFRVRAADAAGNVSPWRESPAVRAGVVSDGSAAIRYAGTWRTARDTGFVGGTERSTRTGGATASVVVRARAVAWIATTGPGRGRARVYVDGVLAATVDLWGADTVSRRVVWTWRWGSIADHRLTIRLPGTPGGRVGLDAIGMLR